MAFPVNSTSHITNSIARVTRVLGRSKVDKDIASGGVYNCRSVAGSSTPSQHSYGNAVDLFPTAGNTQEKLRRIAHNAVRQATRRTVANRGRKCAIAQVIDHDGRVAWEPGRGWFPYTGTKGPHIHISGRPMYSGPCGERP